MGTSTQKSQAFGLNDSMYRFGPISFLAYAAYPILFPVFMAATQKSLFALIPIKIWSFIWMVDQQNEYIQRICLYQEEPVVLWTDASEIGWEAHMDTLQIAREVECV